MAVTRSFGNAVLLTCVAALGCAALALSAGAANMLSVGDCEKWNGAMGQPAFSSTDTSTPEKAEKEPAAMSIWPAIIR